MTTYIPDSLRREVIERAHDRCEYCRVHQDDRFFVHEIDHIYAEKHGGQTRAENLCLACSECNRAKGSDLCSLDPETEMIVALFHPRRNRWAEHFRILDGILEPLTANGRVTARLLHFNEPDAIDRRRSLIDSGHYPSS